MGIERSVVMAVDAAVPKVTQPFTLADTTHRQQETPRSFGKPVAGWLRGGDHRHPFSTTEVDPSVRTTRVGI